jgi:hypothetical protein
VLRPHRGPVEAKKAAALEDAIDDRVSEIIVVKDGDPAARMFVGREDHRAPPDVAAVDDVIEDVRGVVAVREVADFVDDEHVRLDVASERFVHASVATRRREVLDHGCGGGEERVETVLHCAIRERDGKVCLPATRLAFEDDGAAFRDEARGEERADRRESKRGLVAEVEFFDRAEKWKRSTTYLCLPTVSGITFVARDGVLVLNLELPDDELRAKIRVVLKLSVLEERALHPADEPLDRAFLVATPWRAHLDADTDVDDCLREGRVELVDTFPSRACATVRDVLGLRDASVRHVLGPICQGSIRIAPNQKTPARLQNSSSV